MVFWVDGLEVETPYLLCSCGHNPTLPREFQRPDPPVFGTNHHFVFAFNVVSACGQGLILTEVNISTEDLTRRSASKRPTSVVFELVHI